MGRYNFEFFSNNSNIFTITIKFMFRFFGRKRSASHAEDSSDQKLSYSQKIIKALESNNPTFLKKLIISNISTINNAIDDKGRTTTHIACELGLDECLEILIKSGADLTVTDSFGNTPLHSGADHISILMILLKRKTIEPNRLANERQSLLHLMAKKISPINEELWNILKKVWKFNFILLF